MKQVIPSESGLFLIPKPGKQPGFLTVQMRWDYHKKKIIRLSAGHVNTSNTLIFLVDQRLLCVLKLNSGHIFVQNVQSNNIVNITD